MFLHESGTRTLMTQQFKGIETLEINILRPLASAHFIIVNIMKISNKSTLGMLSKP